MTIDNGHDNEKAYHWHLKPPGFAGKRCPICGFPRKRAGCRGGGHRATRKEEGFATRHLVRVKSPNGWQVSEVGSLWEYKPPQKSEKRGISLAVAKRIAEAATLFVQGRMVREVANVMGVSDTTIGNWRRTYPGEWTKAYDAAMHRVVELARQEVATDAVLTDPNQWLRMAEISEAWCVEKGISLFKTSGEPTLASFYDSYFKPVCMASLVGQSGAHYERSIKRWRLFTGDPPLTEITALTLLKFRTCLSKLVGVRHHLPATDRTVNNGMRHIQAILDKAGPPGIRNRQAAGILASVPWLKPLKSTLPARKIVTAEQFKDVLAAAIAMDVPSVPGVKPSQWWRALLVLCWYTGLRRRTIFELRWEDLDLTNRVAMIPAERMKSNRPHVVPLHPEAVAALKTIRRSETGSVFFDGVKVGQFHKWLHRLETAAGIERADHWGLHALRRTLATSLYEQNPGAAVLAMGHTAETITRQHYVKPDAIVSRAIDALPALNQIVSVLQRKGGVEA